MKKYNVGIVGYGWVATAHIPAINATSLGHVTAVCSSRKLDAAELSSFKVGLPSRGFQPLRHGQPLPMLSILTTQRLLAR